MKKRIFWCLFLVSVLFLAGCQGNIYAQNIEGTVAISPDLTSQCVISLAFTEADYYSVVQSNNWDDPQKEFAHQVAVIGIGWGEDQPYTYQYRSENGLVWVDLYTKFKSPQDLGGLVGDAQTQADKDAAETKMGEKILPSSLESYSTSYTDIFELKNGIGAIGNITQYKWSYIMPGTIYDTNGTLLKNNQAVWNWSAEQGGANMIVKSAGLTEFSTVWIIDIVDYKNANLSLALYGNKEMFSLASKIYGKGNIDEIIAKRVASGLDLPAYTVTNSTNDNNYLIKLSMNFNSVEVMNDLLKSAGILQSIDYSYKPGLLNNTYQFSALLPSTSQKIGYPKNTSIILNLPGNVGNNATINTNGKPTWSSSTSKNVQLSASSENINVNSILIIGASILCLMVLAGVGIFAYRKRSSKPTI